MYELIFLLNDISSGDEWRKMRKILTPAFHFKILEEQVGVCHPATTILISRLKCETGSKEVDIYPYINLCALDIICGK